MCFLTSGQDYMDQDSDQLRNGRFYDSFFFVKLEEFGLTVSK